MLLGPCLAEEHCDLLVVVESGLSNCEEVIVEPSGANTVKLFIEERFAQLSS